MSYVDLSNADVLEAAKKKVKSIDRIRKNNDFMRRQRVRKKHLRVHKILRYLSLGLIKIPFYTHKQADLYLRNCMNYVFYPDTITCGQQRYRCLCIIRACRANDKPHIRLSDKDVCDIGI